MNDSRMPKDMMDSKLATESRPVGHPALHFKDVCKRDVKLTVIDSGSWGQETIAAGGTMLFKE